MFYNSECEMCRMVRLLITMKYYYVYVLRSKTKSGFLYVEFSASHKARIEQHNLGNVQSTKSYAPYELIFLEVYINKNDAKRRENYLNTTKGKTTLRTMLKETLT